MDILHVHVPKSGTVAKRIGLTAAGLATGYQRTGNTTLSASAVATTGGYILMDVASLPWYSPVSWDEPYLDVTEDLVSQEKQGLIEGYKAMAIENNSLAEHLLPIALETWPDWDN